VPTAYGNVRVKVSGEGALQKAKPEFEDCRRLAEEHQVAIGAVYQAALTALAAVQH
jgi:uncharacterized protein (DUF111 family)